MKWRCLGGIWNAKAKFGSLIEDNWIFLWRPHLEIGFYADTFVEVSLLLEFIGVDDLKPFHG